MSNYEGFDPLGMIINRSPQDTQKTILEEAKKREISNILKCYTGHFDLFAEMLQNSLDAVEKRWKMQPNYNPQIAIEISLRDNSVGVLDNGTGMTQKEFEFCLAPNISFKSSDKLRGNKGVGATFLAYGYNNLKIFTKSPEFQASVCLEGGRNWIDDSTWTNERPKFKDNSGQSFPYDQGTGFWIKLQSNEKPKLKAITGSSPDQWYGALRITTPLGGIYLTKIENRVKPSITITVIESDGTSNIKKYTLAEYLYPHEIPNLKVESICEIDKAMNSLPGAMDEKFSKLNDRFKKLNAIYEIWDCNAILNDLNPINISSGLTADQIELLKAHSTSVYAFFCNTTRIFDVFNDDVLKLKKGLRLLRGGLQIASDSMPQGEVITIPLKRTIGYQQNIHVIVHYENGDPDLGRKVFQPEKKDIALLLSENAAKLLIKYRSYLKADETAEPLVGSLERHQWINEQEEIYKKNPLIKSSTVSEVTVLSEPSKEQDVVALFNQLLSIGVLKGLEIYSTSEHTRYDSLFRLNYSGHNKYVYSATDTLGISDNAVLSFPFISEPKVLEYKYDFDALVRETQTGDKVNEHINLVVAWNASLRYQDKVELKSLLPDRGKDIRTIYGSTHAAYLFGHYDRPIYEVILLEDLLNYLSDPIKECQRQNRYEVC